MNELIAKPVVKNKIWIVESDPGNKVGNIMMVDEGGVVYIHDDQREMFPSIKILSQKYNITFAAPDKKKATTVAHDVYGFPTASKPHNQVLDVQRYLPIYTKSAKSKSFFCAGYYIVKYTHTWVKEYCPKLITLNRYEYQGPFKSQERAVAAMNEVNE